MSRMVKRRQKCEPFVIAPHFLLILLMVDASDVAHRECIVAGGRAKPVDTIACKLGGALIFRFSLLREG